MAIDALSWRVEMGSAAFRTSKPALRSGPRYIAARCQISDKKKLAIFYYKITHGLK